MAKIKLNEWQSKLMSNLEKDFPNIYQRITEVIEEDQDLGYYGLDEVKDAKSMLHCFDFILSDDLQDDIPSVPEADELYDHMTYLSEISNKYLESRQELARFVTLMKEGKGKSKHGK